ncbi:MAG: STAS domain-containing protein [Deltaproteobacteria bacterium]|nr:STAS domain-containing protein [Deltaproteobacteria bacterium]
MINATYCFPIPCTRLCGEEALALCQKLPLDSIQENGVVVLSLEWVREFDTGGIAALVQTLARASGADLVLRLVHLPEDLSTLFSELGFAKSFGVSTSAIALDLVGGEEIAA